MTPDSVKVAIGGRCGIGTIERHLQRWAPVSAMSSPAVVEIDLSQLAFCTPAIAVTLRVGIREMLAQGFAADGSRLIEPVGDCGGYLRRMDVFKGLVDFENPEQFRRHQPYGFRPVVDIVDLRSAVEASREAIRCVQERVVLSDVIEKALFTALGEISENTVYHAPGGGPASLMAQSYRGDGGFEIEIAAADVGPGIPSTLRRNAAHAHLSDMQALRAALGKNVTGVTDNSRRGLGLWVISEIVAANMGTLVIRTGEVALRQVGPVVEVSGGAARWPGTLIALRLRLDQPLELPEAFTSGVEMDDYETIEF